jgi:hypothetical protein
MQRLNRSSMHAPTEAVLHVTKFHHSFMFIIYTTTIRSTWYLFQKALRRECALESGDKTLMFPNLGLRYTRVATFITRPLKT